MRPTGMDTAFDDLARRSEAHKQGGELPAAGESAVAPARPVDAEPSSDPIPDKASRLEVRP